MSKDSPPSLADIRTPDYHESGILVRGKRKVGNTDIQADTKNADNENHVTDCRESSNSLSLKREYTSIDKDKAILPRWVVPSVQGSIALRDFARPLDQPA